MPIAAELFAHGGILRASNGNETGIAGDADVTADSLANIFVPAFLDLGRQEGVGNGGACRADHVHDAALNGRDHAVG